MRSIRHRDSGGGGPPCAAGWWRGRRPQRDAGVEIIRRFQVCSFLFHTRMKQLLHTRTKQLHRNHLFAPTTKLRGLRPLHHGSLASRAPVVPLPRFAVAEKCVLILATPRASLFFRSTMSNSDAPSRHRRKPGNDDADSIPAMRFASGSSFTLQKSLPRMDGRRRLCSPKREAERRTAHQRLPRLDAQARPRPNK
jgi:hypothetical protein